MAFAGYNRHMDVIESSELAVELSSFSAAVHSVYVKRQGRYVTLRLPDEKLHSYDPSYSGNTIFPYAGRIKKAVWKGVKLDGNDGCNSLHGGFSAHEACFDLLDKSRVHALYHLYRKAGEDCRTLHATSRCTLALPLPKAAQGHPRQKETKRDKRKQRSHKMWNLL